MAGVEKNGESRRKNERDMSEYDSPWKEALEVYFERFLAFFFPHIHADIDWRRGYEFLDKELQQIAPEAATGRRTVDKLVKVWRKSGQEEWVLIHIEVQSQSETEFELRMFQYNYRIFDRYNRRVVSLAILADDRADWRPSSYGSSLWGCSVEFQFPVVKLSRRVSPQAVWRIALASNIEKRYSPGRIFLQSRKRP